MTAIIINPYAHVPPPEAATVEYRATKTASNTSSASFTFSACDIGTAVVGRRVLAAIMFWESADRSITSVTIGGVPATIHAQIQGDVSSSSSKHTCAIVSAPLDAGTTADIVVTLSGSANAQLKACATYKLTGVQSDTAVGTNTDDRTGNSGAWSLTVDVEEGGVLIAATFCVASVTGTVYDYTAGVDDDAVTIINANNKFAVGSLEVTADETGRTVTLGADDNFRGSRVLVSLR